MDARRMLSRGVTTGIRLGRGTADRIVTVAGPGLGRLADRVVDRVRRPEPRRIAVFSPSKQAGSGPSPATVARNIGPQRPSATPPPRKPQRQSVPGAKLPPPRPSTT